MQEKIAWLFFSRRPVVSRNCLIFRQRDHAHPYRFAESDPDQRQEFVNLAWQIG